MKATGLCLLFVLSQVLLAKSVITLNGKVTDEQGAPLSYALVKVQNTGVTTDELGLFNLQLPPGKHRIEIELIGYQAKTLEIDLQQQQFIEVILAEEARQLGEVVVTATRTSRSIYNVPVPAEVISGEQIEQIGSFRLNEVLMEQTGLQATSDHGAGVMMQGLPSEYILFLIDGEPVIGRTAGTLDLNRLAVDNIERVEIIKGPSSSLYGSEAMAGVVNIITSETEQGFSASLRSRYRSYSTSDLSANVSYQNNKISASLFADRFGTAGYDLTVESVAMTSPPFQAYTVNPKLTYDISKSVQLKVNSRFYIENQQNTVDIIVDDETFRLDDRAQLQDWNLMPTLLIKLRDQHNIQIRSYTTGYQTDNSLRYQSDGALYSKNSFDQLFNRSEVQYDYYINDQHVTTAGAGHTLENVEATRYTDVNAFQATYGFVQHQWIPNGKFNLIAGGRYDMHSAYASRFSPKLAAGYTLTDWLKVQASFGGGYKAPDFRQLLLNFTNPVAGYTVVGSSIVQERMAALEAEGQIDAIFIDPSTIETIRAETSLAYNGGLQFTPGNFSGEISLFRNDISNLIESAPIARKSNGQNIFSYFNFDEVVTQGVEVNACYRINSAFQLSAGYQYLDSRNLEDVRRLENEEVFRRDPSTNRTEVVTLSDYGGLPNRSRHSGNAKIFCQNRKHDFDASLRAIYRGAWGLGDANGNGLIDAANEFADGYLLVNLALNKKVWKWLTVEAGANNLLNRTHPFEPALPGRIWYGGLNFNFSQFNDSKSQ